MAGIFRNYPLTLYKFGDENSVNLFQNLSVFISILDEMKDDIAFYETQFISDYERPDTLSYKLYDTTDYYWTFFYLNTDIRESGWPLAELELLQKAKEDYPHWTVTTKNNISNQFAVGSRVQGSSSGSTGVVVKRYLDLGQVIIKGENNFSNGERIFDIDQTGDYMDVHSQIHQYNSVHHYENTSGEWVDIDPHTQVTTGLIPITYMNRIREKNTSLREIKVLKPTVAAQVKSEYNKLLRGY